MSDALDISRPYYLEERQERILETLEDRSVLRISELSKEFGVSTTTIRKDLSTLEKLGKLRRTHGGAIKIGSANHEDVTTVAACKAHEEKVRIGKKAAELVCDDDVIYVSSGTTCLEFIRALAGRRNLTVITCDMQNAMAAEDALEDSSIVLIGGTLRQGFHYSQGTEALGQLKRYRVQTAFLGCNGFDFWRGFVAHRAEQGIWVESVIGQADRSIILMDSSKLGVRAFALAAETSEIDLLITDSGTSNETQARLAEEHPELHVIYA